MGRQLKFTVWLDGKEYLGGSSPTDVSLPDHVWEDADDSGPASIGTLESPARGRADVASLVELAERAFENADDPASRWLAAVTTVLTELGIDVSQRSLVDEAQPRVEEESASQFESVSVTEGGDAAEVPDDAGETPPPADVAHSQASTPEVPKPVAKVPPRSGKGSSAAAWLAYAQANNVDVHAEAERHEIIASLDEAGVPTE